MVLPKPGLILQLCYKPCILNPFPMMTLKDFWYLIIPSISPASKAQAWRKGGWPGKFQSTSSFHQNGEHIAQAHCEHGYVHLELAYRPHLTSRFSTWSISRFAGETLKWGVGLHLLGYDVSHPFGALWTSFHSKVVDKGLAIGSNITVCFKSGRMEWRNRSSWNIYH